MRLRLNKLTYLVGIFIIISIVNSAFNFTGINLRSPSYLIFTFIIINDIFVECMRWYNSVTRFNIFRKLCFLFFLMHPYIIVALILIGFRNPPTSLTPNSIILSGINMTLQIVIGIYFLRSVSIKNFDEINKFICLIAYVFLIEYIFTSIFAIDTAFGSSDEFVGFINSEWHISLIALLGFFAAMNDWVLKRKMKFIFYIFSFLVLGFVAQLRIFQLGIVIYLYFSIFSLTKMKIHFQVLGIICLVIFFFIFGTSILNSSYSVNLFDRFYLFAKQFNLILSYPVLGVGGNISEKYYLETSPDLIYLFSDLTGLSKISVFTETISQNETMATEGYYFKRSSHSTHLDLIGDYGILGIIILILSIVWPLRILGKIQKLRKKRELDLRVQQSAIAVLSLSGFYSLESTGQYLWIGLLLFAYMLHVDRLRGKQS